MSDHQGRRRLATPKMRLEYEPDDRDVLLSHLEGLDRERLAELGELAESVLKLIGYAEGVLDAHEEMETPNE